MVYNMIIDIGEFEHMYSIWFNHGVSIHLCNKVKVQSHDDYAVFIQGYVDIMWGANHIMRNTTETFKFFRI